MFEHFTDRARAVLFVAKAEASNVQHQCAGTAHLLMGLLRVMPEDAVRVLEAMGIKVEELKKKISSEFKPDVDPVAPKDVYLAPSFKEALDFARQEARNRGHRDADTVDLLLGILETHNGLAVTTLWQHGATLDKARAAAIQLSM